MSKPEKSPSFQFYPKDWLTDMKVMQMSNEERGIYIQLLCMDWLEDGIEKEFFEQFKGSSTLVERCFKKHPKKENFFTNFKLQKEREKQKEWRKKCSHAGKKSAKTKQEQRVKQGNVSCDLVTTKKQGRGVLNGNSSTSTSTSNNNISINRNIKHKTSSEQFPSLFFTEDERKKLRQRFKDENLSLPEGLEKLELWVQDKLKTGTATAKRQAEQSHYRMMIGWVLKEVRDEKRSKINYTNAIERTKGGQDAN